MRTIHAVVEVLESKISDVRSCSDTPRDSRVTLMTGKHLGGGEYIPMCNEKRDQAIRWLQIEYAHHGRTPEIFQERETHLNLWSRRSGRGNAWMISRD